MRVTAEAKQATRRRILQAAERLFNSNGFDGTTTRDIARAAGIAAGTLFNYFPGKEAVAASLVADALGRGRRDFATKRRDGASLEEDLFLLVACELRRLKPCRRFMQPALETAFHPFARAAAIPDAESVRVNHLEIVERLLAEHGAAEQIPAIAMPMYWTLYTGVLAFWTGDSSPRQEDTLALLDQSLRMFVAWLRQAEA